MAYTIFNNFKTFYLNILSNFYLCFNVVFPYYDDVIITLQKRALIELYKRTSSTAIKKKRFINFMNEIYELLDEYSILINNERNIELVPLEKTDYSEELFNDSDTDSNDSNPENCTENKEE